MKKILIFNFYKGVLLRGIPIYCDNLVLALEKNGYKVHQFTCPAVLSKLPRSIIDVLFVFCEQLIMPLVGLFGQYHKIIYPYNSTSVLSALSSKSLLIIHDFIPNKRVKTSKSLASLYIVLSQRIHAWLKRDVAFVSATTQRIGKNVSWLKGCKTYLFPNAFYLFVEAFNSDKNTKVNLENYAVLISGNGSNKQFSKALRLWGMLPSSDLRLKVVGVGAHSGWAKNITDEIGLDNIDILPILSDMELVRVIRDSSLMWAHSTHEGFGRPVIEGRICGLNVIATNIPAFREHKDMNVFLYDDSTFLEVFAKAVGSPKNKEYEIKYHTILENEVTKWLLKTK